MEDVCKKLQKLGLEPGIAVNGLEVRRASERVHVEVATFWIRRVRSAARRSVHRRYAACRNRGGEQARQLEKLPAVQVHGETSVIVDMVDDQPVGCGPDLAQQLDKIAGGYAHGDALPRRIRGQRKRVEHRTATALIAPSAGRNPGEEDVVVAGDLRKVDPRSG